MQNEMQSTATLPEPGEVFIALPGGGLAAGKKLQKEDLTPDAFEKYEHYLKDRNIPGEPVLYLNANDKNTRPSIKEGAVLGRNDSTILLINPAEFQASPEYFRKLEVSQAQMDGLVAKHLLTDAAHGSEEDKKHFAEFKQALQEVGADPVTKFYINKDKHTGPHKPISSGITSEGAPYVIAYERDIKHWNALQFEGLAAHDGVHVRDGDNTPERLAAVFNDKTRTLSRTMERHADDVAAEKTGHPEAMAQALQIGLDLQLKAYRKETGNSEQDYFKEMATLDPFHDPIKDRIDRLNAKAVVSPSKPR